MSTYRLATTRPPTITLQNHSFHFRIYKEFLHEGETRLATVGQITFHKDAHETWQAAHARLVLFVNAWLATYEEALDIQQQIDTWMETHPFTT